MTISRVAFSVLTRDFGVTVAAGQDVDLSQRLPGGGTLADHVRPEWFETSAASDETDGAADPGVQPQPMRRRRGAADKE